MCPLDILHSQTSQKLQIIQGTDGPRMPGWSSSFPFPHFLLLKQQTCFNMIFILTPPWRNFFFCKFQHQKGNFSKAKIIFAISSPWPKRAWLHGILCFLCYSAYTQMLSLVLVLPDHRKVFLNLGQNLQSLQFALPLSKHVLPAIQENSASSSLSKHLPLRSVCGSMFDFSPLSGWRWRH